jgi:hypothetical protein
MVVTGDCKGCQRLDVLGFARDQLADEWEDGVDYLERYRQDQGDCLVPHSYRDQASGFRLGGWVNNRGQDQDPMSPERRQRPDALGFVWKVR